MIQGRQTWASLVKRAIRSASLALGEDLNGYVTVELGVGRTPDFAMPPSPSLDVMR
jgi:hypothetical protein